MIELTYRTYIDHYLNSHNYDETFKQFAQNRLSDFDFIIKFDRKHEIVLRGIRPWRNLQKEDLGCYWSCSSDGKYSDFFLAFRSKEDYILWKLNL